MITSNANIALILGHPGHELRVHRFLEIYKPRVYVITDGSGSIEKSRVHNTLKIIRQTGATASEVMGRFTDLEIYRIIKDADTLQLTELVDEIVSDLELHNINVIAGDSVEGFNPTHDLCRYMINSVAKIYSDKIGKDIPNYEFLLDGPPHQCPQALKEEASWIKLTEADFERKYSAACNYPEILHEVEKVIRNYGSLPFLTECLWPVKDYKAFKNWNSDEPYYETWGKEKVISGEYNEVISYQAHLLPLARFLAQYSEVKEHESTLNEHLA